MKIFDAENEPATAGGAQDGASGGGGGPALRTGLERMRTGIPGLDHLLDGGLVRGNSLLLEGPPGSGKSTLAMRVLYEGIVQYREPGLLITFDECPRQLQMEALQFGLDLKALEAAGMLRIVWTPPARIVKGFAGKIDLIDKIVDELGVRRLVIDNITHLRGVAPDEHGLREVLSQILNALKIRGITSFLVKELDRTDGGAIEFEEYLVDASIRLYNAAPAAGGESIRQIEVRKTRGQAHVSGRHPLGLNADGVAVYPRPAPAGAAANRTGVGPAMSADSHWEAAHRAGPLRILHHDPASVQTPEPAMDARPHSEGWISPLKRYRERAWIPEAVSNPPGGVPVPGAAQAIPVPAADSGSSSGSG